MTHRLGREKILCEYEQPKVDKIYFEFNIQKYNGPKNRALEPHGEGKAKLVNGYRYEGNFRKGNPHGKGLIALREGYRYEGHWRKGMVHGMGRMHYPDCSWYEGEFRKGRRNGCGTYHYPNGARYEGNWLKDKRHGVGVYVFSRGDITLKGTWIEGVARGPAEVIMDNCRFHGYWEGEYPKGPGYFSFGAKVMIKGKFYNNGCSGKMPNMLVWQPEGMENYEYSRLPLEPLPLPIDDSEISEISSSDEDECISYDSTIVLSE